MCRWRAGRQRGLYVFKNGRIGRAAIFEAQKPFDGGKIFETGCDGGDFQSRLRVLPLSLVNGAVRQVVGVNLAFPGSEKCFGRHAMIHE